VFALDRLRELHRIANEHEVASCSTCGNDVGKRDLAGFVHKEVVELLIVLGAREQPGGAGDQWIGRKARILIFGCAIDGRIRR
jgi:hypothetical protein